MFEFERLLLFDCTSEVDGVLVVVILFVPISEEDGVLLAVLFKETETAAVNDDSLDDVTDALPIAEFEVQ